jgi:alpha-L-fucosidase
MRRFVVRALKAIGLLVFVCALALGGWLWKGVRDASVDLPPATAGRYQPSESSLNSHRVPAWFADAKFGVFIHWGLFSVPGFAPNGDFTTVLRTDYARAMLVHPYAEDYWNAIKDPTTPSAAFHRSHYGDMPYQGFARIFEQNLAHWDPDRWAGIFAAAGARYVVLVAKYHDGFSLWPTRVPNPHQADWSSRRDVVGELAAAVRRHGLRFGVYYSGGVDWTFEPRISRTLGDYIGSTPGGDYPAYADAQVRELVVKYQPDVLWNDIGWPTDRDSLFRLFADYYNSHPDGVVNDRWSETNIASLLMRPWMSRRLVDLAIEQALRQNPDALKVMTPPVIPHSDFTTPEYTQYAEIQSKKWEMTRGIGHSFGYNRNERDSDYASSEELLREFIDAVSKNGNLLLNVGPTGDTMEIPPEQLSRLTDVGRWLRANGEAIYDTVPWRQSDATTADGTPVRFTRRPDAVNVIVLGRPFGSTLTIRGVVLSGAGRLLSDGSPVAVAVSGNGTILTCAHPLDGSFAPVVAITPPASSP